MNLKEYRRVKITLKELFNKLGVIDFTEPEVIPIGELGIKIKSFDFTTNEETFSTIENLVIKDPVAQHFILNSKSGEQLKTTAHHKSFINGEWLESFRRFELEEGHEKIDKVMKVVDLSIKDTECYYANGQLNHNTTTGGNALKFYASVRLDIRRISAIKQANDIIGNRTRVKVVKSKVSPPFKEVEFDILYGSGISTAGDICDTAVNFGIIKKAGAWYTFGEDRFQGRDQLVNVIKSDQVVQEMLKSQIREVFSTGALPSISTESN